MADQIDRRKFLARGARTLTGAAALGVAGPRLFEGSRLAHSPSAGVKPGSLGALAMVGAWVPDVETGGEYIADTEGYWKQLGFSSVDIIPSGPNAPPQEVTVETGRALYGLSSLDATSAAIVKGFGLAVIGAEYQKSPFCVMSAASKPIKTPHDMIGKKIGVGSSNDQVWSEFLKVNHISPSQVTTVPVSFDPTPLTQGTVDGWWSFITNEPIELALKGFKTYTFLVQDWGLPEISTIFITTKTALVSARAKLKAALIGEIMGWKKALTDPALAAKLAVKRGQGLTYEAELLQSYAQNKLIVPPGKAPNGLFYISPLAQAQGVHTVGLGGTKVTPKEVFDLSLLDEIYAQYPGLKAVPKPNYG
jgi:ABC-type nitrate/sulfonate/bicarbonate transport system substrate-binding protein